MLLFVSDSNCQKYAGLRTNLIAMPRALQGDLIRLLLIGFLPSLFSPIVVALVGYATAGNWHSEDATSIGDRAMFSSKAKEGEFVH